MGFGFQKKKKSSKQLEKDTQTVANNVQRALMGLQMQLNFLGQRLQQLEQNVLMIDYRSLTTMKLAKSKGIFTEAEHSALAEITQIEDFDRNSEKDDADRLLEPTEDPIGPGTNYVTRITGYDPATKERLANVSSLRTKATFGQGELPEVFDTNLAGKKAGETVTFQIKCPPEMQLAGQEIEFVVEILRVAKPKPKPVLEAVPGGPVTEMTASNTVV